MITVPMPSGVEHIYAAAGYPTDQHMITVPMPSGVEHMRRTSGCDR